MAHQKREKKPKLWKDYLDKKRVTKISEVIGSIYKKFDDNAFIKRVCDRSYTQLEMKERINRIADLLNDMLPSNYKQKMTILKKAAPMLGDFDNWALLTIVEKHGLDNFEESVKAMEELTSHSTAEFAIRPYMIAYTDKMMPVLNRWAEHENHHVRRLAAEGARPRGVWVKRIDAFIKDPKPVIELLDKLKTDDSLYVRKAVANCLNDISKDHPMLVLTTAERWLKETNSHKHTLWIIKRACRTLIKQGEPKAFALFGFEKNPKVKISKLTWAKKKIKIGDDVLFSFEVLSQKKSKQKLAVDYIVHYIKKNGKSSPKVFKLTEKTVAPGAVLKLSTKHSFKEMTTRKHYSGKHKLEVMVNGVVQGGLEFDLR